MDRKKALSILLILVSAAVVGGCQIVQVKDLAGNAVIGAKVDVIDSRGASKLLTPSITGLDGSAMLPLPMGKTPEFIMVSKEGYAVQRIGRPDDTTVKIKLPKQSKAAAPAIPPTKKSSTKSGAPETGGTSNAKTR